MSKGACVSRRGGWGDNLSISTVFKQLRAKYGRLEVITRYPAGVVFENNPHVDVLTIWPEKDSESAEFQHKMLRRRLDEFDFGVDLSSTMEGRLAFFWQQSEFGWTAKARRMLADHSYLGYIHDICDLPHDYDPGFYPTTAEVVKATADIAGYRAKRNGPIVGWCLCGSRIDKMYPGDVQVITRLLEAGCIVLMFGKPDKDYTRACEIQKQVELQVGSLEGLWSCITVQADIAPGMLVAKKTTGVAPMETGPKPFTWPMRRTLATLQQCDVVIGPDTGAMWAVAMRPMRKVVLLSHASEKNITEGWINTTTLHADPGRVPCWPCHQLHNEWATCNKHPELDAAACIADIRIAAVVEAAMDGLRDWQPPPPGLTYDPWMFDVTTLDAAKRIILTPASGIDTEQRWSTETPYLADLVDRTLHLDERSLVLDYGCGVGRLSKELIARYGCRVVGVDISTGMRTLAVQYVDSDRFFACGPDGLDSLVAHGTLFDLAVAVWVLQHCGNVAEDVERIVRALAPTGRLFVVNEKGRLVPTAGTDWANDGIDVLTLLRENLAEEAHGSLSTDHVAELLTRCAYWSTFRAGPPAKEPLDA